MLMFQVFVNVGDERRDHADHRHPAAADELRRLVRDRHLLVALGLLQSDLRAGAARPRHPSQRCSRESPALVTRMAVSNVRKEFDAKAGTGLRRPRARPASRYSRQEAATRRPAGQRRPRAAEGRRRLARRRALHRAPRPPLDRRQHLQGPRRQRAAPGMEAAFVDIGLEKNGFLHVDEIVLPGGEQAPRRGRGRGGPRIAELLKPGQEIVVQVVKDPLKTKGARLSMELSIAGRYLVYAPDGEGVGVSRRLAGQGARAAAQAGLRASTLQGGGADRPHRRARRAQERLRARAAVPASSSTRCSRAASRSRSAPDDGLPGGRPARSASCATSSRASSSARSSTTRSSTTGSTQLLHAHRARAGRPRRALRGRRSRCSRATGVDEVVRPTAVAPGRPAASAAT